MTERDGRSQGTDHGEVQWLVVTIRRVCLMLLHLIEQRYPHLKGRRCANCDHPILE